VSRSQRQLYVGTSGYSYRHWADGVFYPRGLRSNEYLGYYSQQFRTVEINSSFYRVPRAEYLRRWATVTAGNFVFAAKLNRQVTHYQKLRNCTEALAQNKVLRDELGSKLGPLLAQLPPSLHADHALLTDFLALLKQDSGSWIGKLAFEFRHSSWLVDRTYELLDQSDCAICLADWKSCTPTEPNDVDFVYIRRHGPEGRYAGCYTKAQLKKDAKLIEKCLQAGKAVYAYFNNDAKGYAVKNARELLELAGTAD